MIITDKDFYKNLNLRLVYLLSVIDFTWKSMLRDYFYAISVLLLYKGPWWTKRGWPNETFLTKEPSKITSELFHCSLRSIGQFTHKAHFGKQMYKLKTNSLYVCIWNKILLTNQLLNGLCSFLFNKLDSYVEVDYIIKTCLMVVCVHL